MGLLLDNETMSTQLTCPSNPGHLTLTPVLQLTGL